MCQITTFCACVNFQADASSGFANLRRLVSTCESVWSLQGLSLNRTSGKDSRVRLRTNFLSITCCTIKCKEIMYFGTNCHLAQLFGLSCAERLVWEFESGRFSFFFPFSRFLSLVSFFRARLSVSVRFRVSVLSLTRLSFPLVRFRRNPLQGFRCCLKWEGRSLLYSEGL